MKTYTTHHVREDDKFGIKADYMKEHECFVLTVGDVQIFIPETRVDVVRGIRYACSRIIILRDKIKED